MNCYSIGVKSYLLKPPNLRLIFAKSYLELNISIQDMKLIDSLFVEAISLKQISLKKYPTLYNFLFKSKCETFNNDADCYAIYCNSNVLCIQCNSINSIKLVKTKHIKNSKFESFVYYLHCKSLTHDSIINKIFSESIKSNDSY